MKKRFRVMLLTLVLSISMLAPEFSMLPAVYAEDQTPALEQTTDADSQNVPETASPAANEAADPDAADDEAGVNAGDATDIEGAGLGEAGTEDDPAAGDTAGTEAEPAAADETGTEADPEAPQLDISSYGKFYMTELYDAGAIKLPEEAQDKITIEHTEYGNGLLFSGTVADLNSTYITLGYDFDFDKGSIGRLTFDGLKNKDVGMDVEVQLYLDDCKSPTATFVLKKQMGKHEWENDGEKTVSMGTSEITGKHKVSLLLKISGKKDSAKTSVMLRSMQFCVTTVPVMYFNIDESEGTIEAMNSSEDHSVECYGSVDLVVPDAFNNDKSFRDEYGEQESQYGMDLEYIRGRGNSTWMSEKKPYKVKFDKSQDFFGFGKNKHWILLANRFDNSLVRNRMTYWLGQQLGMEYTPQCVPVEVVMNGEFYGSYLLCEQIRVGTGRVTIDDLDDEDPLAITDPLVETGGYLLSLDYEEDPKRHFETEGNMSFYIESPDDNVAFFNEYIKAFTQKVENAIFGENFMDADGHRYTEYLDLDAAVDYWWVQEFSCNGDAFGSGSTYLYKRRDPDEDNQGKLYWGPLWDFDYVAWGDLNYDCDPDSTLDYTHCVWFNAMKSDAEFIDKVQKRWSEEGGLRDQLVEITREGGRLDMYLAQMETSYNYDHGKWGAYDSELTEYKGEIEQLRTWINKRIEYVDEAVRAMEVEDHIVKFVIDGKVVKKMTVHGFLFSRDFPEAPEKKGYVFTGWYDKNGEEYVSGYKVTEDVTLTARYVDKSKLPQAEKIYFKYNEAYTTIYEDSYYGGYGGGGYFNDYRVMPDDVDTSEIVWKSSNEKVAVCDEDGGSLELMGYGDAVITATFPNGVSSSYKLHVVKENELVWCEEYKLSRSSMTLKVGKYNQLRAIPEEVPSYEPTLTWLSLDEKIATVDPLGIVEAKKPGTTYILMYDTDNGALHKCKLTVKPTSYKGYTVKRSGSTYKITSDKKGSRTAMLVKGKNASKVVIPATIKLDGKKYSVNKIKAKAFAKSKATKLIIKTKKLTKARVKNALKGSKVKKIYVRVGKKSLNKTYIKKYKKLFLKKIAGRYATVSSWAGK